MVTRIKIELSEEELDALYRFSDDDLRHHEIEAKAIIRKELIRLGYLPEPKKYQSDHQAKAEGGKSDR